MFPRVGPIATNTQLRRPTVLQFYDKRGKAAQWIKEGKQAVRLGLQYH